MNILHTWGYAQKNNSLLINKLYKSIQGLIKNKQKIYFCMWWSCCIA